MRIIIASTPKTGNIWAKCLLAQIYNLEILFKPPSDEEQLKDSHQKGWFEDNTIFHQHFSPTEAFFNLIESIGCQVVTTIRSPYDTFVSLFYFVQNFPKQFNRPEDPLHVLCGKPIDHPDVLNYISQGDEGFGLHIQVALEWLESHKTIIIRYENLQKEPVQELKRATDQIFPTTSAAIKDAIQACKAEKMRSQRKAWAKHIRKAETGDWQNHLTEAHLEVFRSRHGDLIQKLGYEVA
jgi:hypothetical protein